MALPVRSYSVVPFPMKVMRKHVDGGELRIGDFESLGIFLFVEFSTYSQARLGSRSGNEFDDCAKAAQGFAAPVDADERKKPMLDFIPLTGSRRQVAHRVLFPAGDLQFPSIPVSRMTLEVRRCAAAPRWH